MEHQVRLEFGDQPEYPLAIADIGDAALDHGRARFDGELFQHGVQGRFRILDDQQPAGAEIDDAIADLGADRAAAAGDDDGLAGDEVLETPIIDLHARPQQQIFDIDRRQPQRFLAGVERRHPAGGETEPARQHQHRFRMQVRTERARRQHQPADANALRPQRDDGRFKIGEETAHRNAAQLLALIGRRRRQNSDRLNFLTAPLSIGAQQHFSIGGAPGHQRRNCIGTFDLLLRARMPEQAVGDARAAEEKHLQQPIERDRNFAEEEGAVERRIQQDVIEHQQRNRQHRHGAEDVAQIRQRGEPPLRHVKVEIPVHDAGIDDVAGQNDDQPMVALGQAAVVAILEANIERRQYRQRRDGEVVKDDQNAARIAEKSHHGVIIVQAGRAR